MGSPAPVTVPDLFSPHVQPVSSDVQHVSTTPPTEGESDTLQTQKRRSKFTPEDDIILLREAAAASAHMVPHGEKGERYAAAADAANNNPRLTQKVTAKSLQDRYIRLQKEYDEAEQKQRMMSGVGGEAGEMEELLLSEMGHAREDLLQEKEERRNASEAVEAREIEVGAMLIKKAQSRAAPGPIKSITDTGSSGEENAAAKMGKGTGKRSINHELDDASTFTDVIRESEPARISLQRDELAFREKRFKMKIEERAKERDEPRAEREENIKSDLDKFKMMIGTQTSMLKDIVASLKK